MFAGTILALRYELACVSDQQATAVTALRRVALIAICAGGALALLAQFAGRSSALPVLVFAVAFFFQQATALYLSTLRYFGIAACLRVLANLLFLIFFSIWRWFAEADEGIPAFGIFSAISAIISVCAAIVLLYKSRHIKSELSLTEFLRRHVRYPKYTLPATLMGATSLYGLSIIVPHWFDPIDAGYFAFAYRLGAFPVSLVAQSIGTVIRRDAVAAIAQGASLSNVLRPYTLGLFCTIGLYVVLGTALYNPAVRNLIGSNWVESNRYFYTLLPLFSLQLLYVPLSQIFIALEAQQLDFRIQLVNAATVVLTLTICKLAGATLIHTVAWFSAGASLVQLLGLTLCFRLRRQRTSPSYSAQLISNASQ